MINGKVVIVTGSSSGICRETAIAFAQKGAKVVIAARRTLEGEEVVKQIVDAGREAIFARTEVTQVKEMKALVNPALEHYSQIDCAFNNANLHGCG
jgi:NAD(P)-dependent dehydrogenase (short-subunit alcohol dehydrogenase family)